MGRNHHGGGTVARPPGQTRGGLGIKSQPSSITVRTHGLWAAIRGKSNRRIILGPDELSENMFNVIAVPATFTRGPEGEQRGITYEGEVIDG
jgi:hypothetical protein